MKATIVNTVENTTKHVELPENITTVADLKGILNIDGKIYEGTSRTDLLSDSQRLPQLSEAKASRGYVFFVSPTADKIKNGLPTRRELYALIKANNLQDEVKHKFSGRNCTQVATDKLIELLAQHNVSFEDVSEAESAPVEVEPAISTEKELLFALVDLLNATEFEEQQHLTEIVKEGIERVFPNPYSVQDIDNMRR